MTKIVKKILYYVIPFTYTENYKTALDLAKKNDLKLCTKTKSESDLYDYISEEFLSIDKEKNELGTTFYKDCNLDLLFYQKEKINKLHIQDFNLYLFINNVGFFVYSIDAKDVDSKNELINFQNAIKELNKKDSILYKRISRKELPEEYNNEEKCSYYLPFTFGNWISKEIEFLDVRFTPKRKNIMLNIENYCEQYSDEHNKILDINDEIVKNIIKKYTSKNDVPDKAICFTYSSFDVDEQIDKVELEDYSYHITNGYKESYKYSQSINEKPYYPFDNVIWFSSIEGCSITVLPNNDNINFFKGNFESKIESDYLHLYIKALFESYSLMKYSTDISKKLSNNKQDYFEANEYNDLIDIQTDINLFMSKAITTNVSYISHQTGFYSYIKKTLNIEENTKTVNSGLDYLNVLQKDAENKKSQIKDIEMSKTLSYLTSIQSICAICSVFSLIKLFVDNDVSQVNSIQELFASNQLASVIFAVISILIVYFVLKNLKDVMKKDETK